MRAAILVTMLVASCFAVSARASASEPYAFTVIHFPRTVKAGPIAGVDRRGDIAGVGYETGNDYPDCMYFDGTTLLDLTPNSGNWCHFTGMNSHGVAVGQYYDFNRYLNLAVLYQGGKLSTIDRVIDSFLAFDDKSLAVANRTVDGFAVYDVPTRSIAFDLYDQEGQCAMSFPFAINDAGIVLGEDQCVAGQTRYETVADGTFSYFRLPQGFSLSTNARQGAAFNNRGEVALGKTGSGHVFLWSTSQEVPPHDLGTLAADPNGVYTLTALSDDMAAGTTSDGYSWIWTQRDGMRDLSTLVRHNALGWIQPQALDAEGDIACSVANNAFVWVYLRARR